MGKQRGLRIAEIRDGNAPSLESDPHIPLKIVWVAPSVGQGPTVYVRASDLAGGELEFRIDRTSGDLRVVTILSLGAFVTEPAPAYPDAPIEHGCGVVIDHGLWDKTLDNVIDVELLLRPYPLEQGLRVDIAGVEPVRRVGCGPHLTLAMDADGFLASLEAQIEIDQRHFRS